MFSYKLTFSVTLDPESPNLFSPNPGRRLVGVLKIKNPQNLQGLIYVRCEYQFKFKIFLLTNTNNPSFRFPSLFFLCSLTLAAVAARSRRHHSSFCTVRPALYELCTGCSCFGVVTLDIYIVHMRMVKGSGLCSVVLSGTCDCRPKAVWTVRRKMFEFRSRHITCLQCIFGAIMTTWFAHARMVCCAVSTVDRFLLCSVEFRI